MKLGCVAPPAKNQTRKKKERRRRRRRCGGGRREKSGGSLEITDSAREFRKRGMEWGEEEEGEKGLQHQQANQRPQALLSEFVDRLSVDISEKGGTG